MRLHRWLIPLLVAACQRAQGPIPPAAEFLVAAGDSTFWIRTGKEGVSVRGAPIALARFDGRLYELYVTDDDRSYFDAVMIGQRLYRRDLITGDSSAVVEDTIVAKLASAYARAHPAERQLEPYEEASDDPQIYATADLEIVGVHGPWLSFEHHSDIGLPDGSEIHSIARGVVDLRSGRRGTVKDLFGAAEARRAIAEARASFASGIDSLLSAPGHEAQQVAGVLRDLRFDPESFSVSHRATQPTVIFLVPGEGEWATDLAFPLSPVPVAAPAWWGDVRPLLSSASEDDPEDVWAPSGPSPMIIARYDTTERIATLILRDSASQEWKAGQVPPPVDWILRLDVPPLDSATRQGLRRAFDEAALYSEDTRIAAAGASRPMHALVFRPVARQSAGRHASPRIGRSSWRRSPAVRPGSLHPRPVPAQPPSMSRAR